MDGDAGTPGRAAPETPQEHHVHALQRAPPGGDRFLDSLKAGDGTRPTASNARGMIRSPSDGSTTYTVLVSGQYILRRCPIGRPPELPVRHSRRNGR